jgi:hypothetical protein
MRGAIHPLPQYAFMAWCPVKEKAQGLLYLYLLIAFDWLALLLHILKVPVSNLCPEAASFLQPITQTLDDHLNITQTDLFHSLYK